MTLANVTPADVSHMSIKDLNSFINKKQEMYADNKKNCLNSKDETYCEAANTHEQDMNNAQCRITQLTYDELEREKESYETQIRDFNKEFDNQAFVDEDDKNNAIAGKKDFMKIFETKLNKIKDQLKDKEASLCKAAKGGKRSRKSKKRSRKMKKKSRKYKRSKKNRK